MSIKELSVKKEATGYSTELLILGHDSKKYDEMIELISEITMESCYSQKKRDKKIYELKSCFLIFIYPYLDKIGFKDIIKTQNCNFFSIAGKNRLDIVENYPVSGTVGTLRTTLSFLFTPQLPNQLEVINLISLIAIPNEQELLKLTLCSILNLDFKITCINSCSCINSYYSISNIKELSFFVGKYLFFTKALHYKIDILKEVTKGISILANELTMPSKRQNKKLLSILEVLK